MTEDFFQKLKILRKGKKLSQTEMANKIGVVLRQYQRYEKGLMPGIDKLVKLSEVLEYDFMRHFSPANSDQSKKREEPTATESSTDVYKDKYIALLEESREQGKKYESVIEALKTKYETTVGELTQRSEAYAIRILALQQFVLDLAAEQRKGRRANQIEVLSTIENEIRAGNKDKGSDVGSYTLSKQLELA